MDVIIARSAVKTILVLLSAFRYEMGRHVDCGHGHVCRNRFYGWWEAIGTIGISIKVKMKTEMGVNWTDRRKSTAPEPSHPNH